MKGTNVLLATCVLLGASATWADADPMEEYRLHCGLTYSEEACAALVARLEALERPGPEARLALTRAKRMLDRSDDAVYDSERLCPEVGAILADHPDYAQALHRAAFCTGDRNEMIDLLRRALEIEPGNHSALGSLAFFNWYWEDNFGMDPRTLAGYREALYEASLERAAWKLSAARPDHPSYAIWSDVRRAARYIYVAAVRSGDSGAAATIQARVRRDLGLDDLDYPPERPCDGAFDRERPYLDPLCRGGRADHLALACHPMIVGSLDLEDVCVAAVERLTGKASAAGLAIPDDVLAAAEHTAWELRRKACDRLRVPGEMWDKCYGREATETPAVARLGAVLEHHEGRLSPEHRRGACHGIPRRRGAAGRAARGAARRCGQRPGPLRPGARGGGPGDYAAAGGLLGPDGDTDCLKLNHGFTLLDREDYLAAREARRRNPTAELSFEDRVEAAGMKPAGAAD